MSSAMASVGSQRARLRHQAQATAGAAVQPAPATDRRCGGSALSNSIRHPPPPRSIGITIVAAPPGRGVAVAIVMASVAVVALMNRCQASSLQVDAMRSRRPAMTARSRSLDHDGTLSAVGRGNRDGGLHQSLSRALTQISSMLACCATPARRL